MYFPSVSLLAITLSAISTTSAAFPTAQWLKPTINAPASPTLPSCALPSPSTSLKLIALGLGTQNYTCASPTSPPASIGARANLYDATNIFTAISQNPLLSNIAADRATCLADHTDTSLGLPQVGVHYFNGNGVPNFDLSAVDMYLQAKKLGTDAAPADACTGRDGNAAVAWLILGEDGSGMSRGVSSVYRVETAGGLAMSCAGTAPGQVVTSDYSAEYWFYE